MKALEIEIRKVFKSNVWIYLGLFIYLFFKKEGMNNVDMTDGICQERRMKIIKYSERSWKWGFPSHATIQR